MAELIAIVGQSGTGKSTSVKTLDPKTTVMINITGKPLPFRGWLGSYNPEVKISEGGNYFEGDKTGDITKILQYVSDKRPEIKSIVIDDAQYNMAFEFFRRAKEKGYDKYTDIGTNMFMILDTAKKLRRDLKVYILFHEETVAEGFNKKRKIKTIGTMVDNYLTIEGLCTIVLFTQVEFNDKEKKGEYYFITQSDGSTTAKSPEGMFDSNKLPNDLQLVSDAVDKYNKG
jgi:hypothetical protein